MGHRQAAADPDGHHLVVLARDPEGYARLSRVVSEAHLAGGEKGQPVVSLTTLAEAHGGHWMVLTGCRKGEAMARATASGAVWSTVIASSSSSTANAAPPSCTGGTSTRNRITRRVALCRIGHLPRCST